MVLSSFLIAFLAGFVAFESVDHTRYSERPRVWVFLGGATLGLGIWSMNFTGMVAWQPPFALYYTIGRTILSVVVAIIACWLALHLVFENVSRRPVTTKLVGALLVGSGICAMHYIGMSALHFSGPVTWHWDWILLSFLIAVSASWAAMDLLDRSGIGMRSLGSQLGASIIIAMAICGMHYSAMQAFAVGPGTTCLRLPESFSGPLLARMGVGNAMIITFGLLVVSYRDKAVWTAMVTQARGEADESARKLEGIVAAGKIAASVAHEINNPLEAITNLLYLAQSGNVGSTEREYLATAQEELRRIAAITTHTLRFYKQQSQPTSTSIPELFESALVLFQNALNSSKIDVVREWALDTPNVVCLEGEIRQVLTNLISNGIDAMPDGGTLRLSIDVEADGLKVAVSDTGEGISPDLHNRILEPFFTTKGRKGTGLGLPISAEIIARHGGRFNFDNVNGAPFAGARFEFFLPFGQVVVPTAQTR